MPVGEGHSGRGGVQALPPHAAVAGLAHVGEDGVLGDGGHGVRVGLVGGAGRHAEEAVLRVDGPQLPCGDASRETVSSMGLNGMNFIDPPTQDGNRINVL